jgi:GT2 family glycosyltransferase
MANNIVVICTRNRNKELTKALDSIQSQTQHPDLVLIVDSSDIFKHVIGDYKFKINHIQSEKNLTFQRNKALKMLSDLQDDARIHFFDDDVILGDRYIEKISENFDVFSHIDGICARTSEILDKKPNIYMRIFMLDSIHSGRLLRSGVNVSFRKVDANYEVDWFPGCCMSYRFEKIRNLTFDESRKGVGWGEDVDFSYRLSKECRLLCVPDLEIMHSLSVTNRDSKIVQYFRVIENRFKLAQIPQSKVHEIFILWSLIGEIPLLMTLKVKGLIQLALRS